MATTGTLTVNLKEVYESNRHDHAAEARSLYEGCASARGHQLQGAKAVEVLFGAPLAGAMMRPAEAIFENVRNMRDAYESALIAEREKAQEYSAKIKAASDSISNDLDHLVSIARFAADWIEDRMKRSRSADVPAWLADLIDLTTSDATP